MKSVKTLIISFFVCTAFIIVLGIATLIIVTLSRLVIDAFPNVGSIIVGLVLTSGLVALFITMGANDKVA